MIKIYKTTLIILIGLTACNQKNKVDNVISPSVITQPVLHDTDDPAIWVNKQDPSKSLIIGTDKGGDSGEGAVYVYDLRGKIVESKTVRNIKRPNNVDIAYDFYYNGELIDIAICTERYTNSIRVFRLPQMEPVDNGGIEVFEGEELRDPMGIATFTDPKSGSISVIVGRKTGPTDGTYLWQYALTADTLGIVTAQLKRKFGNFSDVKEIEAIAVDNELGYVYYSDEGVGIRKYYAHPDSSSVELSLFGTKDFVRDNEGISIYKMNDGTGYILVSDQQANKFHVYPREGAINNAHEHKLITSVNTSTIESDGSEVTSSSLNDTFVNGLFIAMSDDKTFQLYKWEDIAGEQLIVARDGKKQVQP